MPIVFLNGSSAPRAGDAGGPSAVPQPVDTPPGQAARLINWMGAQHFIAYTDAQMGQLGDGTSGAAYGLGMGGIMGTNNGWQWTGDPSNNLSGGLFAQQLNEKNNNVHQRARTHGLNKLYLGTSTNLLGNVTNSKPVFADWFDNTSWGTGSAEDQTTVLGIIRSFGGAARLMSWDGVGFDMEVGQWDWAYTGNTHTQTQVRSQVFTRGQQMMTALLAGWNDFGGPTPPGKVPDIFVYHNTFDGGINAVVGTASFGNAPNLKSTTYVTQNFWDGMTSIGGWGRIHFGESNFYTGAPIGSQMQTCMMIDVVGSLATLSGQLSNWAYANNRIDFAPFMWLLNNGDGPEPNFYADHAMPPDSTANGGITATSGGRIVGQQEMYNYMPPGQEVTDINFQNFTTGGNPPVGTNFVPCYTNATGGTVNSTLPTLTGTVITRDNATTVHATGTAHHDLGIRAVRWQAPGNTGAASHVVNYDHTLTASGFTIPDYTQTPGNFTFSFTWTATGILAKEGEYITFIVEDTKGRIQTYNIQAP